jgi:diaminopimelate decarboxylase
MARSALLDLFPPATDQDDDGMLRVGGCRLDALADQFGTPALVVDEPALRARAREFRTEFEARRPDTLVAFASKAFPCTAVQRVMISEGIGLDVAGAGELFSALAAGADPARMLLHGNAKTTEEIELAVENGLGTVVVDNTDDLDRLEAVVPRGRRQGCLVRVIPGIQASTHAAIATGHATSKFGLSPEAAKEAIRRIEASPLLRMDGLHTHVGSQIMDVEQLAAAVRPLARLGSFPVYDLGGGLGARYTYDDREPTVAEYAEALTSAARAQLPASARLIVEPGRSLVARAGTTIYRVTTVKRGRLVHVAVDGGMGDNLEVSLFQQRFEATIADRVGGGERCVLVGRHCESGDVLSDGVPLREPAVGDLLAVPVTGAYCFTMSNQYNGARRIPVVFAGSGTARLVVRRDTWADLRSRDVLD